MTGTFRQLAHVFAAEVAGIDCRNPLSRDQIAAVEAGMDK